MNPNTFASLGLHPRLLRALESQGFRTPTPIQVRAVPPALEGRDLLASAATGSGKTAAFLLPLLQRAADHPGHTRVLVLTPTRELAAQVVEHGRRLAAGSPLRLEAVFGGVGMKPQVRAFRRGVEVLAATPGRLLDHFRHDYARLAHLQALVLDEADRMLDMGFLPDVKRILRHLPSPLQTLLFSATLPPAIRDLSGKILDHPVRVHVESKTPTAEGIHQEVHHLPRQEKSRFLLDLLRREHTTVLAFTRTKHRADRLARFLERGGVACARIHGNRSQAQRTAALEGFRRGRYRVLVATDIAARGIDVKDIGLVVNFDPPGQAEDYIHRVGRTGRASARGRALTLVDPGEASDFRRLESRLGRRIPRTETSSPELRPAAPKPPPRGRRRPRHASRRKVSAA